jgi:hypothetical protein
MKQPAFQFYPGDWRKDPNLSRASLSAKGAMIEIMCLAFECEKRGVLKTAGKAWSIDEIAMAIGGDFENNKSAIWELLDKKILKKDRKGAIFSQRMCRDEKIRKLRKEAGCKGGNPILLNQKVNLPANQKLTPSSSSSSSSSEIKESIEKKTPSLENSNLFRKAKIPSFSEVHEAFKKNGGTKEMAEKFYHKHSATEWFLNGSPITNFSSLVYGFIDNWKRITPDYKTEFVQ